MLFQLAVNINHEFVRQQNPKQKPTIYYLFLDIVF